jgi:hypothetical protein
MRTLPEIVLATRQGRTTKARLPKAWRVRHVTLNTLMKSRGLAPITIVDAKTPEELSDFPEFTRTLAEHRKDLSRTSWCFALIAAKAWMWGRK